MMELPSALRSRIVERGSIFHSVMFDNIDHGKFFAVVGVTADSVIGFFFINSNIHPSLQRRPEQFAMQYPLRHRDYPFLRYDSFLCATALIKYPLTKILESIDNGCTTLVGALTPDDLNAVLEACRLSPLFSAADKRKYFY